MKIKTELDLQPAESRANSVVVYDDKDNPIFAAIEILGDTVVCAQADEADFEHVLKLICNDAPPKIIHIGEKAK